MRLTGFAIWLIGLTLAGLKFSVRQLQMILFSPDRWAVGIGIKTVQFGWPIGMPVVRKMEAGLWEVRIDLKDGIARVLFTVVGSAMILLHGFVKKSEKTPASDLAVARQRKAALERNK